MTGRWVTLVAAGIAVAAVAVVAVAAGAGPYDALGNADPGPAVQLAAPMLRLVADLAATACVGSLVFALAFTGSAAHGELSQRGSAAVSCAGAWAGLWAAAALVLVPVDVADLGAAALFGDSPVSGVSSSPGLFEVLAAMEEPLAWSVAAGLAVLTSVGCGVTALGHRWGRRRPWVMGVLGLALATLLAPLAAGHSSSQTDHDVATAAIMVHVPAAVLWVGSLLALLHPGWRDAERLPHQLRRHGRLALGCSLVLVGSGVVDALALAPPATWLRSGYGWLLLAVVALTVVLLVTLARWRRVVSTWWQERVAVDAGASRPLLVLVVTETLALGAVMGLSVGLTHLPPPAFLRPVDIDQTLLGYDLGGPPTPWRLLTAWRPDPWFGPLAVVLAGVYLAGVRRVSAGGGRWPVARTSAWLSGCAVLLLVTCSGVGRYAAAMFSVHIALHMTLAMVVPVLLGLGAPLTLFRASVPAARPEDLPGPREWVEELLASPAARLATHPVVTWTLFVGAPFALFFTPLVDAAARFHWAQLLLDAAFLVIGALFAWVVLGVDPAPRPLPALLRLGLLVAAMPVDAVFAALVTDCPWVIGDGDAGANMYSSLALPWLHGDLLGDQRVAGAVALALGELAMLAALAAVLLRTRASDGGLLAGLAEEAPGPDRSSGPIGVSR